jgi:hypothetical protein
MAGARDTSQSSPSLLIAPTGAKAWACDLFETAQFPDKRLERRAQKIVATLAAKPTDSIPQAFPDWPAVKAAYRFIENDRITSEAIRAPQSDAAARRCASLPLVLAVQDTTGLTFPKARSMEGVGAVNDLTKGIMLHTALALAPDGGPLGVLDLQWWARDPEQTGKAKARKSLAIEEKESAKWLRGMRAARKAFRANRPALDEGRLIHVFDREGDVHEVFEEIDLAQGEGAVIRCAQSRRAREKKDDALGCSKQIVRSAPLLGTTTLDVPRAHERHARFDVAVELRSCRLTLCPSKEQHPKRRPLALTLVELWEKEPPQGGEALHWLLWTTEPAETLEEALAIVALYRLRWRIADYHLVLKDGCRAEELQFETAERAAKVIYLYAAVAVRILSLRELSRREPEAPCTRTLSGEEWRTLWTYIHQKPPSPQTPPPTIRQAVLWIGRLGGHLGRKSDGMPGVKTLWRGWRDLENLVTIYCATTR